MVDYGNRTRPHTHHSCVFYSPGENFDSPPVHTRFSGGKNGFSIVTGEMTYPAGNPRSVQKRGVEMFADQNDTYVHQKWGPSAPLPVPANLATS